MERIYTTYLIFNARISSIPKQMYLWFTTTIPVTTTFITSITGSITIASVLLSCAVRKSKRPYKPGHLPEFVDPSTKEADTYYGMRSTIAFPVKGIKIKRKHDLKEQQARADIELNPETKNRNDLDGRIQLGSIPIRENSKPVSFPTQNFHFKRSKCASSIYISMKHSDNNKNVNEATTRPEKFLKIPKEKKEIENYTL
ncbi:unnamed protein product [Brugia timori]|uniref:Uncharacterized protein n=1 Tax=Brugia timori TaxID=42155 RepID=A0A0R3Q788_9BILA|nr:unnamed protein product [Brugia timori]